MTSFNDLSDVCGVLFCSQVFMNRYKTNSLLLVIWELLKITLARDWVGVVSNCNMGLFSETIIDRVSFPGAGTQQRVTWGGSAPR